MESLTSKELGDFASLLNTQANVVRRILSEFASTHSRGIPGSGWDEHAQINLRVACHQRTLNEGDQIEVEIELANTQRTAVRLVRIEDAAPAGFEPLENPSGLHVADGSLDFDDMDPWIVRLLVAVQS